MCDRTQDLLQIVSSSSSGQKQINNLHATTKTPFNEATNEIAKGIHRTVSLLSKLSSLVKKQGLFDDPTDEINALIHRIKEDLDGLNNKCDEVQQFIDSKKSFFESSTSQASQHNSKVISHLKTDLMGATKDFKSVLELRSNKMKDQQNRKVQLIGKGMFSPAREVELLINKEGNNSLSRRSNTGNERNNQLVAKRNTILPSPYNTNSMELSQTAYADIEDRKQQQQLLLQPPATSQYYESREKAVTEVEKTIGELGQLFRRLSTMIAEQQEMVERIDEDVENAMTNTNSARDALMQAYERVSSNRGMYMKIIAILAAFIIFFVLFVL